MLVPRLLPEAGARRDQPGGRAHHAARSASPTRAAHGRRQPKEPRSDASAASSDATSSPRRSTTAPLAADADRLRRRRWSGCSSRRSCRGAARHAIQVGLTLVGLVGAFVAVVLVSRRRHQGGTRRGRGRHRRPGAVPAGHDPRARAPRRADHGRAVRRRRARTRSRPGAPRPGLGAGGARRRAPASRPDRGLPADLFAVGGMMLFPAAGDLLTMFVALEVLSLPLYMLVGLARRRRLLSQEASLKYFLLGAFSSAFFLFGIGAALRLLRLDVLSRHRRRRSARSRHGRPAARRASCWSSVGLLFKVGAVPFHSLDAGRLPGRPDPGHRLHGRLHQGRGVRRDAAARLRRRRRQRAGTGSRCCGPWRS